MPKIIEPEKIDLKDHPTITEAVIQQKIAENPGILGLGGDLILKDKERIQPRAGRLDLLLQDENNRRYEVEIQLGKTDESHIIRTIEYWDTERKRYMTDAVIGQSAKYGYYVSIGSGESTVYLHADGQWRKSTSKMTNGVETLSGYFPSRHAAVEAASRAGFRIEDQAFKKLETVFKASSIHLSSRPGGSLGR